MSYKPLLYFLLTIAFVLLGLGVVFTSGNFFVATLCFVCTWFCIIEMGNGHDK